MTAWELLLRDFQDCVVLGGEGEFFVVFFFKGKVDHCSLPTWSVVGLQCCMLVGYIIHNSVTEGGGNGWWCVQDGTAIFEQSLALQRHFIFFKHPRALFVVGGVVSFKKSRKRSYSSGELGDCGIGFVSVLCFVLFFYHLPVVLLLLVLSPTPRF